jgi:hypothetical protein
MPEKESIFSSKVKYTGVFPFSSFYKFCYDWLMEETNLNMLAEEKYKEKLKGNTKEIDIKWKGYKKMTDYFKYDIKVKFEIKELKNVEVMQNGIKVSTNQGQCKVSVSGILVRDYQGKFEKSAFQKFLRAIYEKWVIPAVIDKFEDKVTDDCDEFLNQIKAYFDLEGKK